MAEETRCSKCRGDQVCGRPEPTARLLPKLSEQMRGSNLYYYKSDLATLHSVDLSQAPTRYSCTNRAQISSGKPVEIQKNSAMEL